MKQTKNFLLNLMEAADALSVKPINENTEKIEAALLAQQAGGVMMAVGSYMGDGKMSVSIETPGMKPKILFVREQPTSLGCSGWYPSGKGFTIGDNTDTLEMDGGWLLWLGQDIPVEYGYVTGYDDEGNAVGKNANTFVRFVSNIGGLSWSVSDANAKNLSRLVNNRNSQKYDWVAIGTAQ